MTPEAIAVAASVAETDSRYTEVALAQGFYETFKGLIKYSYPSKKWYFYDDQKWAKDERGYMERIGEEMVLSLYADLPGIRKGREDFFKFIEKMNTASGISNLIKLVRKRDPVLETEFDQDPNLFNCRNYTFNLETGKTQPHRKEDLISKMGNVDYDPLAIWTEWEKHLNLIFDGNKELIKDFHKICGYCLFAGNPEAKIFILYGKGRNGKTVTLEVLQTIFGSYSCSIAPETLMLSKGERVRTDLLHMIGSRLITSVEPKKRSRLDASLIKAATGGDILTARHLYGEEVDFKLVGKILLATNYKPEIDDQSIAMWERVVLIPFNHYFPKESQDKKIVQKLLKESSGILNWCIEGYKNYLRDGYFKFSAAITQATTEYQNSEDAFYEFLSSQCVQKPGYHVGAKDLYKEYVNWCTLTDTPAISQYKFGRAMSERFDKKHERTGYSYYGLEIGKEPSQTEIVGKCDGL